MRTAAKIALGVLMAPVVVVYAVLVAIVMLLPMAGSIGYWVITKDDRPMEWVVDTLDVLYFVNR